MTQLPEHAVIAQLLRQLQEFRRQLARWDMQVDTDPASPITEQLTRWQQVILDHLQRCKAQVDSLRQMEVAQQESEHRLWRFIENAPVAIAMFDREMRYLVVSRRWLHDYGLDGQHILGQSHYAIFPEISEAWKAVHQRGLAGEVVRATDDRFVRADGTVQWLRWEVRPWYHGGETVGGIIIFTEDITELKAVEEELKRRNRALQLLSVTNETLIRATSEESLLQRVCDIAIEIGGYRLTWVGVGGPEAVRPMASAGMKSCEPESTVLLGDTGQTDGREVLSEVFLGRHPVYADDFHAEHRFASWREEALARGYRAGIVLPLIANDEVVGVLALYRAEPYHFSTDERRLLMELANDLAFGVATLRMRAARQQAVEALRQSEAYQREFARRTIEAATEGKLIVSEREEIEQIAGPPIASWQIGQVDDLEAIRHAVADLARSAGMEDDRIDDFLLCISEAATNAFKHAGHGCCALHRVGDALLAEIADQGPGILAINLPEVALKRGYTTGASLGMGYKAMISLADTVYLATGPTGTTVGIQMSLQAPPEPSLSLPSLSALWGED